MPSWLYVDWLNTRFNVKVCWSHIWSFLSAWYESYENQTAVLTHNISSFVLRDLGAHLASGFSTRCLIVSAFPMYPVLGQSNTGSRDLEPLPPSSPLLQIYEYGYSVYILPLTHYDIIMVFPEYALIQSPIHCCRPAVTAVPTRRSSPRPPPAHARHLTVRYPSRDAHLRYMALYWHMCCQPALRLRSSSEAPMPSLLSVAARASRTRAACASCWRDLRVQAQPYARC